MKPETRLTISWTIVAASLVYAGVVMVSRDLASAFAIWYVPVILTLLFIATVWKNPHDRK